MKNHIAVPSRSDRQTPPLPWRQPGEKWRRRGVASALIVSSFKAFRERGLTDAALGVDSENPNGALGLYEGLGFRRYQTGIAHRKEL